MRVGIYELKDPNGKDLAAQRVYETILAHNGIPFVRLRAEQPDFWQRVDELSLFIMRVTQRESDLQQAFDLLPVIERQHGIKCYPNLNTSWHYDDKIKQYHLLHSLGFPITECRVFYDRAEAFRWIEREASFPVVFKLRGGAGSQNVVMVKTQRQARNLVKQMFGKGILPGKLLTSDALRLKHFSLGREVHHLCGNLYRWSRGLDVSPFWRVQKNYILFQKFLPGNNCDTRITVIGDRAFGFRRSVRKNDFRASGSGQIDYDREKINPDAIKIAFDVSQKMGFQSMAYDFLQNEGGQPEFCEISYTYVSKAVQDCPGYWDLEMNWHEGHFCPEHLHLVDALGLFDLKLPAME